MGKVSDRSLRLQSLRRREEEGTLTAGEHEELASIFAEMDAEEMEALRPALERSEMEQAEMRAEVAKLEAPGVRLGYLLADGEQLLRDAQSMIRELRMRHEADGDGVGQSCEPLTRQDVLTRIAAFRTTAQTLAGEIQREGA